MLQRINTGIVNTDGEICGGPKPKRRRDDPPTEPEMAGAQDILRNGTASSLAGLRARVLAELYAVHVRGETNQQIDQNLSKKELLQGLEEYVSGLIPTAM